jgi:hypothetical protein
VDAACGPPALRPPFDGSGAVVCRAGGFLPETTTVNDSLAREISQP